ncbi:MAG TPA: flagellar hook-basal body complex protein [Anaerolineaceae bacterium]
MTSLNHVLDISRQDLQSRMLDLSVVSNNLSNFNTIGYKSIRTNFQEFLDSQLENGVQIASTQTLVKQGAIKASDEPLDMAIEGEGYFAVRLPDGKTGYTRDGQFSLDANRTVVNANGYPLIWNGTIPENFEEVRVRSTGVIEYRVGDDWTQAGSLQLYRFPNAGGLLFLGKNIWLESQASGAVQAGTPESTNFGRLQPKNLEMANMELSEELTHMMTIQRIFTMSLRSFQQTDQMISQAINMRR